MAIRFRNFQLTPYSGRVSSEPFEWTPLAHPDEIRVLKFARVPRERERMLYCEMQHVRLSDSPRYTAVSYSLHGAIPTGRYGKLENFITCNGRSLKVKEGMIYALHRMVSEHEDVSLWIDQFSINQRNPREKERQVELMSQIYSQAEKTIIWLGDARDISEEIDVAFHHLRHLYQHLGHLEDWAAKQRAIETLKQKTQFGKDREWRMLAWLLMRPWFGRVWVLQEATLSRNAVVYCGSMRVAYPEFCEQLKCINESGILINLLNVNRHPQVPPRIHGNRLAVFLKLHQAYSRPHPRRGFIGDQLHSIDHLKYLMAASSYMSAADQRDRLYAVRGLCGGDFPIPVRYGSEVSLAKLYHDIAIHFVKGMNFCRCTEAFCPYNKLSILGEIGGRDDIGELENLSTTDLDIFKSLPSWVPVWTPHHTPSFWGNPLYHASEDTQPEVSLEEDLHRPITLRARGKLCDVVQFASQACPRLDNEHLDPRAQGRTPQANMALRMLPVSQWIKECEPQLEGCRRQGASLEEDFCRTLIADNGESTPNPTGSDQETAGRAHSNTLLDDFEKFLKYNAILQNVSSGLNSWFSKNSSKLKPYSQGFERFVTKFRATSRKFFVTDGGLMGLGPEKMQSGDVVCVFLGAPVPMILRTSHDAKFLVVGDCYIQGIMNGEVFKSRYGTDDITLL